MKSEGKIKWYQCKRDLSITVIILLLFSIAILQFDIFSNFRNNVWHVLRSNYPNPLINLFFEWGMWLPTLAVFIVSLFVCLKHYWSWSLITLVGVSFFLTVDVSNNSEGTMKIIDILRCEFGSIKSLKSFIEGIFTCVIFSSPYIAILSVVVFAIRKKLYKINMRYK